MTNYICVKFITNWSFKTVPCVVVFRYCSISYYYTHVWIPTCAVCFLVFHWTLLSTHRLNRYRPFICTCIGTSFIAAILSIEAVLVIHFLIPHDSNNYAPYSPNDTQIIPYSYQMCQGLTLTSDFSTINPSASLFLLKTPPVLNGSESFSIHRQQVKLDDSTPNVTWAVNMFQGSNLSVSMCGGDPEYPVMFYLIKGSANYSNWNENPDKKYSLKNATISPSCIMLTYNVSLSDEYFLVVYQSNTSTTTSLNVTFSFQRTKYTYSQSSVAASCSIRSDLISCSIGVPMSSGYTALLVLNDTEWRRDTVTIGVNCNSRVWVFVMITFAIALCFIVLINGLIIGCVCLRAWLYQRRSTYVRINWFFFSVCLLILLYTIPGHCYNCMHTLVSIKNLNKF